MTEKIIIDGVDVSGCEFFFSGKYKFCSAHRNIERVDDQYIDFAGKCASHRNCYYKRLRREKPDILELTEKLIKSDEEMKSLQMYSDAITKRSELAEECLEDWKKQYQLLEEKLETKTALLKDAKKAIEKLTIKLQSPLKTKPSDPTEPLYRKLSQIAELAQKLRTKTDYHGEDEVNADLDQILQLINPRGNDER